MDITIAGLRGARKVFQAPAFDGVFQGELYPGFNASAYAFRTYQREKTVLMG
jgi:hypothetical protein